ncbi:MAG: DUF2207 domain-containing protein [Armatimonadetes bacterium]|nr:DUF2207 domain-containing protein [Armatimonadota bacterium]
MVVTETIVADFSADPHHGIWRKIPLSGNDKYGNHYRLREEVIGVTDEKGNPLQAKITASDGRIHFKVGDPNNYVNDRRTYVMKYKLLRAIHLFSEQDELYWNPVGPEWAVPVNNASCIVELPADVPPGKLNTTSYTGVYGSTTTDAQSDTPDNRTARFWMTRPLSPGEAMTIVVGWPKGIVNRPTFMQEAMWFISDNGYFFLPPIFLLGLVLLWFKLGMDPDTGRSEMVAFDPPDNMRPAEMGTLTDERADMRDITATIIDLAVRGYINIKAGTEKGFLFSKTDYTLTLNRPYAETKADEQLSDFERTLITALFGGMDFCVMSMLKNKFYTHVPVLQKQLYNAIVKRGYFTHRPDEVRKSYQGAGIAILAVGVIGGIMLMAADIPTAFAIPAGWGFALGVCGLMLAIASRSMPRKTAKGKNALLGVRGFEEYLSRAEKEEIQHQERNDYFEKFLPYAIALGIADKWARAFEGIQTQPPNWYTDYDGGPFRPTIFAHDLSYATSSWGSDMVSQPRSSGSGGSGFFSGGSGFSGGSSGGGGGGGGGGSW